MPDLMQETRNIMDGYLKTYTITNERIHDEVTFMNTYRNQIIQFIKTHRFTYITL